MFHRNTFFKSWISFISIRSIMHNEKLNDLVKLSTYSVIVEVPKFFKVTLPALIYIAQQSRVLSLIARISQFSKTISSISLMSPFSSARGMKRSGRMSRPMRRRLWYWL